MMPTKMIAFPQISPNLSIEDIHRLREYNYEMTKDMSSDDRLRYYNDAAKSVWAELDAIRVRLSAGE